MDAGVRNLNLVVAVWKLESFRNLLLDLGEVPFRLSFAGGVEGFLDFVFQFKIKLDAKILAPSVLDPSGAVCPVHGLVPADAPAEAGQHSGRGFPGRVAEAFPGGA